MLDLLQSHTRVETKTGMCMSESMDFDRTQVAVFHNFNKPFSVQGAWNWFFKLILKNVFGIWILLFPFFQNAFCLLVQTDQSVTADRFSITYLVLPISSPAKPLVIAFMSRVLSVQSFHSRARISPFRAPVKARRRNRVIFSRSFVFETSFKNF